MVNKLLIIVAILICSQSIFAQKASDVLEYGVHVKTDRKIFLQYANGELKYDATLSLTDPANPPDFTPLEDSLIFLVNKNAVNIYITPPINPLNFSYSTETKEILDPIDESAASGLGSIIDVLNSVRRAPAAHGAALTKCDTLFKFLEKSVRDIQNGLDSNQQKEVNTVFTALKSLSFSYEQQTIDSIAIIKEWKNKIEKHFSDLEAKIKNTKETLKGYDCGAPDIAFTIKYIFTNILKEQDELNAKQKKRLENLQTAFNIVEKTQKTASVSETGLKWCIKLPSIPSIRGKISLYTFTVKESGYRLSDKKEIVNVETKDALKRTLRIRKFQQFVPEVSIGTAFTFLKYNSYGTTSDSTGQQFVGTPIENTIKNLNLTTMINFNYYIPNSPLHPFYQIGVGINSGIPTVLTGFGLRSNINGIKRMAIAAGIAMSWIKELDKLKVGDKISGTDDIEKDYKYSSTPKFSPYVGLQYNF